MPGGAALTAYDPESSVSEHASTQPHNPFYDGPAVFASNAQRICYGNWVLWRHRKSVDILNRKSARNAIIRLFSDGSFAYFSSNPETPAILANSGGTIKDVTSQVRPPVPLPHLPLPLLRARHALCVWQATARIPRGAHPSPALSPE